MRKFSPANYSPAYPKATESNIRAIKRNSARASKSETSRPFRKARPKAEARLTGPRRAGRMAAVTVTAARTVSGWEKMAWTRRTALRLPGALADKKLTEVRAAARIPDPQAPAAPEALRLSPSTTNLKKHLHRRTGPWM